MDAMNSADLIRDIKAVGWVLNRINGSHPIFTHPERGGVVVVPHPKKDLPPGTVRSIRKQAGI